MIKSNGKTSDKFIIEVENLTRYFGSQPALLGIDLRVPPGVVYGLAGANGSGKTTLIRHILGLFRAQQGTVRVFGLDPVADPEGVLGRIGYLSEQRDMPDWMTVEELMSYTRSFYPGWDKEYADELREAFMLDGGKRIKDLSRGQRARTGLLIALAYRPDLLVLDEPSSGLDPMVRRDILAAILRTVADEGRTVLFSSHLLDEIEQTADEVAMLSYGEIALQGSVAEIVANHHCLKLRFTQPRRAAPRLNSALACTGGLREWSVLCREENVAQTTADAIAQGAAIVAQSAPSLEEIFVAHMSLRNSYEPSHWMN